MKQTEFDLIILTTRKNLPVLKRSISRIKRNIAARRYICIGAENLEETVREVLKCDFINEDEVLEGLSLSLIRELIGKLGGNPERAGWYFQQFLKMGYAYKSETDYYLVWDSDTIPVNEVSFFDEKGPVFITKKEYHIPYFDAIDRLFEGKIKRYHPEKSFIAESMIISREYMKEMINAIEANQGLDGRYYYEKIINSVNEKDLSKSGFSEFETYGNYMMITHPEIYTPVKIKTMRLGAFVVGYEPSDRQLEWLSQYYDIVSIENNAKNLKNKIWATWFSVFFKSRLIRKCVNPHKAARAAEKLNRIQNRLRGRGAPVDYDVD